MAEYTTKEIAEALKSDGSIVIKGFGTFRVVVVPARQHRNPRTGEAVMKPAHQAVRFKPSKTILA